MRSRPFMYFTFILLIAISVNAQNNQPLSSMKSAGVNINTQTIQIQSKILDEKRDIYVSLPSNYEQDNHDYPIILVMDGEFMFDLTRSMTTLWASRNYMPKSIIIGIPNPTNDKRFDVALEKKGANGKIYYQGGGDPKMYLQFLKEELFPLLQKKYRIHSNRTIIGLSPTTGLVYQAFWDAPEMFKHFISINGGIGGILTSGKTLGERLLESVTKHQNTSLYIGQTKRTKEIQEKREGVQATFLKNFNQVNSSNVALKIDNLEDESGYGVVIGCLFNAFRFIYPRDVWNVDYSKFLNAQNPAKTLETFYNNLSKKYGYQIYPVETAYNTYYNMDHLTRRLLSAHRLKEAKDLAQLGLRYFPNSANLYYRLSLVNQAENDMENGLIHLKKSVALAKEYNNENLILFQKELVEFTIKK